jgi:Zn-dependent peptidase ImmA (M78 family)
MKIAVKPKVLKALRQSLCIPIDVAASKADVTEEIYASWESKDSEITLGVLRDLAKLFSRHWTTFLLDEPPSLPKPPRDFRTVPNADLSYSRPTIEAFILARRVISLSNEVEGRDYEKGILKTFKASLSGSADDLAKHFTDRFGPSEDERKKIKSPYNLFNFWRNVLEELGINVAEISMEVSEVRAFSMQEGNKAVIVINRSDKINGRVFSLMHEACHLLIGTTGVCDWGHLESSRYLTGRIEVFCNQFAGAALVPSNQLYEELSALDSDSPDLLSQDDTLESLARKFKVSSQVILRRLYALGKIPKQVFDTKYTQLLARYKTEIKIKKDFIPPANFHTLGLIKQNSKAFTTDVINAYKSDLISYRDAGVYLDISAKYLPKIEIELGYK